MKRSGVLVALLLLPAASFAADSTPAEFGAAFCKAGIENDMAPIEAALTPALAAIVADALAKNEAIAAAAPDEKPPLGDGLPWRSWPDYADGCAVGTVMKANGAAVVVINYSFKDQPDANYADELVLLPSARTPGAWELDNINLVNGQTMRTSLAGAFDFEPKD